MLILCNVQDLLCVHYPLLQIKGKLIPFCGCSEVVVRTDRVLDSHFWRLCGSNFKAFAPLRLGWNRVECSCKHFSIHCRLCYSPAPDSFNVVQPLYVVCSDGNGSFQNENGYNSGSPESAVRRIGFAVQLLQSLTAESFFSEYGQRYTFACNEDRAELICRLHRSRLTCTEIYSSQPIDVWSKLARELCNAYPQAFMNTKWIAFMADTRYTAPESQSNLTYQELSKFAKAHFALGAGGLALLGTATLHAWPEDLGSLNTALWNTRRIDHSTVMDDTAYRHTYWAAFATGLGSVWHELGHCLGLDHSLEGIMNRGGDDVHLCIAFPPTGSTCGHGCDKLGPMVSTSDVDFIPLRLNPRPPMPTVLQHERCILRHQPEAADTDRPSAAFNPWSLCHSIWHQGSAFWGHEQIVKLLKSRWIVCASSVAKGNDYVSMKRKVTVDACPT
ncbi:hypothetical protein T265_02561 [Opisthorchis viverrini]|uniref:Zinc metalloproteinase n=1 Tax=Opisthorchis viverrini TaxID=6198 RepID=A0A075AI68_OPIVI|nr:hypothetical protein T265_02561 [Opisthorchis viverrini]KER31109.1 hypothetical protein T265_02561 [Opisthorchis viverrini]